MQCAPGDAGDRRGYGRVREIQLGFANGRSRRRECSGRRSERGRRFLGDALADSCACEQTREAIRFATRLIVGRFCLVGRCLRLCKCNLERCTLDLKEWCTGAYERAFVVQLFLHDAGDACADLDFLRTLSAPDSLEHDGCRADPDSASRHRYWLFAVRVSFTAAGGEPDDAREQENGSKELGARQEHESSKLRWGPAV